MKSLLISNISEEKNISDTMYKIINGIIVSACAAMLLIACQQEKFVGNLAEYPGEKKGIVKTYYESGTVYEVGQFKDGKLHGYRKIHFDDGKVEVEETYVEGAFHGPYIKYYNNGKKKIEGNYEDGSMEGVWKTYYEDGSLKEEVTMHDNLENGPFKEFHPNGNQKAVGTYKNGEFEEGILQLFDESGTLIKTMECSNGICHTIKPELAE